MNQKLNTVLSMVAGALVILGLQNLQQDNAFQMIKTATAAQNVDSIELGTLQSCEVFFSDNRDTFEEEINSRIKKTKLLQSNVLWSETTKQLGFYALICY